MRVTRLEPVMLRSPLAEPVRMSLGQIAARTALLVRIETDEGVTGLGEIWTNFPGWTPSEKIRWLDRMAPEIVGSEVGEPAAAWARLKAKFERFALQAGVLGLVYQVMSGIDVALWDVASQVAGLPLRRFLAARGGGSGRVRVYASGLGPDIVPATIERCLNDGIDAFKLKVGFDERVDRRNTRLLRETIGPDRRLMLDANQGWTVPEALRMADVLGGFHPFWMEEPVRADDLEGLAEFRRRSRLRTAAGENLYGVTAVAHALEAGCVDIIQPDVTKTSGLTDALAAVSLASRHGAALTPHSFGSAVGLMASAHLLAAAGGELPLEVDVTPNPLREVLLVDHPQIRDGHLALPDAPGLGVTLRDDVVEKARLAPAGACPPDAREARRAQTRG